jgi:hypothetical protein
MAASVISAREWLPLRTNVSRTCVADDVGDCSDGLQVPEVLLGEWVEAEEGVREVEPFVAPDPALGFDPGDAEER